MGLGIIAQPLQVDLRVGQLPRVEARALADPLAGRVEVAGLVDGDGGGVGRNGLAELD